MFDKGESRNVIKEGGYSRLIPLKGMVHIIPKLLKPLQHITFMYTAVLKANSINQKACKQLAGCLVLFDTL